MQTIESTGLWHRTLSRAHSDRLEPLAKEFTERLAASFVSFRRQVSRLVGEIPRSFRELTVHDMDHIDALWQCADQLAGDDLSMNPAEAFVLGGAFLLHDAGLALASYSEEPSEIEQSAYWRDAAAFLFLKRHGRAIAKDDWGNLDKEFKQEIHEQVLRLRHAEQAQKLGTKGFSGAQTDPPLFLIEDAELREAYGYSIGEVAYSHWWSTEEVTARLDKIVGAFPGGPADWTVDLFKLAFLMRTSDAIQIDSRRAPALLRALRKPRGIAERHWQFQQLLHQPQIRNGSLFFTSKQPFDVAKSEAWWTGHELAALADSELRAAEICLADKGRPALRAHRVAGLDGRGGLARFVETNGWAPVPTKIHVSDIVSLVSSLGGEGLYGEQPSVALRELVQNARDAVVARRLREDRADNWGEINVSLEKLEDGTLLRVSDNGIGMSASVLSGSLLDFGTSFWRTERMLQEHPKLAAAGFEPNGKYGIGFFSVFMLAEHVRVISRSTEAGISETLVLEFLEGVSGRIMLRDATESERLREPGTLVEIRLKKDPYAEGGLLVPKHVRSRTLPPNRSHKRETPWTLDELCQWLAPALDVDLITSECGTSKESIKANDWTTISEATLIGRLLMFRDLDDRKRIVECENARRIFANMELIYNSSGVPIGRAAIVDMSPFNPDEDRRSFHMSSPSVVTAGQFRSHESIYFCGLFLGQPTRPTRTAGNAYAQMEPKTLASWASSQSVRASKSVDHPHNQASIGGVIRLLGGSSGDLLVFRTKTGFKSFNDIASMDWPDKVELVQDPWGVAGYTEFELRDDQIGVSLSKGKKLHDWSRKKDPLNRAEHPIWDRFWMAHWGAAIEAVAKSWGERLAAVLDASTFHGRERPNEDGSSTLTSDTLVKPK